METDYNKVAVPEMKELKDGKEALGFVSPDRSNS